MVTFAIGRGNETALMPKHVQTAEEMADTLQNQLRDIQVLEGQIFLFLGAVLISPLLLPSLLFSPCFVQKHRHAYAHAPRQ